ncbi:PilL (plasmid) [Pseudomonas fluorescens R124]|uniref:PilL n=1 Tax=Pseudomonas fluorescens R124 TaxID=743713 RepID=K0WNG7_PSEFL|nr:PilL [Pseudomonas fluorescens R124]EJZ60942.1 PilL [Pseudomonas fluorescens R124]
MKCKLVASELLCAALLLGCSAPKLTLPSGDWVEVNQPAFPVPPRAAVPPAPPVPPIAAPVPAVSIPTPRAPIVFGSPPATTPQQPAVATASPGSLGWAPGSSSTTTPPGRLPVASLATPAKPPVVVAAAEPAKPVTLPPKVFTAPPAPPVPVIAPVAKPIKPTPIPKPVWEAKPGDSLRGVIKSWSQRANYEVAWEAEDLDYPIDAPLRFEGTYEEAVAGIFQLYEKADRSFVVDGRRAQHRLNVSENSVKSKNKRAP